MISVIVPIYNKQKYLNKCINSIINQTYKNIEIILVNDGSTDSSLEICNNFLYDSRIKIIDKKNGGVSNARNEGLRQCIGEKILFVDADDYIELDYIEKMAKFNEDIVIGGYYTDNGKEIMIGDKLNLYLSNKEEIKNEILKRKYTKLLVVPYVKLFKKEIIDNSNILFNEKISFGEDACFVLEYLMNCNTVRFTDYCGYYNVISEGTLSRKYIKNIEEQLTFINEKIDKFDSNESEIDYWKFRNFKLILFNEKDNKYNNFKNFIKKYETKIKIFNKNNNITDVILIILFKLKCYFLIYVIYYYIK